MREMRWTHADFLIRSWKMRYHERRTRAIHMQLHMVLFSPKTRFRTFKWRGKRRFIRKETIQRETVIRRWQSTTRTISAHSQYLSPQSTCCLREGLTSVEMKTVMAARKDDNSMVARQPIERLVLLFGCRSSLLDSDSGWGLRFPGLNLGDSLRSKNRDLPLEPRMRERVLQVPEFEGECMLQREWVLQ